MIANTRLSLQTLPLHLLLEDLLSLSLHYNSIEAISATAVQLITHLSLLQYTVNPFLLLSLHFLHLPLFLLRLLLRLLSCLFLLLCLIGEMGTHNLLHRHGALLDSLIHIKELNRGLLLLPLTGKRNGSLYSSFQRRRNRSLS